MELENIFLRDGRETLLIPPAYAEYSGASLTCKKEEWFKEHITSNEFTVLLVSSKNFSHSNPSSQAFLLYKPLSHSF